MSQFSLFVNGNAEDLRHMFVAHKGLTIGLAPVRFSEIDLGGVTSSFTSAIRRNVVDPGLSQWMIPQFSTTTARDSAVAAFGMIGAMKQYVKYSIRGGSGFPSVTLLGNRSDWEMIANRVDKLRKYSEECEHWASLLQPIMRYMLRTFDEPDSQEVKDFWLRVAYEAGIDDSGNEVRTLSGWITAFAYFQDNGRVTTDYKEDDISQLDEKSIKLDRKRLTLDGVSYPLISLREIPSS